MVAAALGAVTLTMMARTPQWRQHASCTRLVAPAAFAAGNVKRSHVEAGVPGSNEFDDYAAKLEKCEPDHQGR